MVRTRAAVVLAARSLFLKQGYAGTTMDEIAELAGLTKRTLYNNYSDKDALFVEIVADISTVAAEFARGLHERVILTITAANLRSALSEMGEHLALAIVRTEVVALRRLLIGEARSFPVLAREYFDNAPGSVLLALAAGFTHLHQQRLLHIDNADIAAGQFAYLLVGEPLDRAMLTGVIPAPDYITRVAREGVATFLARYATPIPSLPGL